MPQHIIYESRKDYEKRMQERDKRIQLKEGWAISAIILLIGLIIFIWAVAGTIRGHLNESWIMLIAGAILTWFGSLGVKNKFKNEN